MDVAIKKTAFHVDVESCIGCSRCVEACPMKILSVQDGLCSMVKSYMCLECGTCRVICPQHAISINATDAQEIVAVHTGDGSRQTRIVFTPILERLVEIVSTEFNTVQQFNYKGTDISELNDIDFEDQRCYVRCYSAEKLEKCSVCSMKFLGEMSSEVLVLVPGIEYDIPLFMMDWTEFVDSVFFICDFFPTDDPVRNQRYLSEYLYEPLEDMYYTHGEIPGLKSSPIYWVRAIASPYMITGYVDKQPRENVAKLVNCAVDYLYAWIKLWRKAEPRKPNSPHMKLVHKRRKIIHELFHDNDPGIGSINKIIGEEKGKTAIEVLMP